MQTASKLRLDGVTEKNICAPVAICSAIGVEFKEVHAVMERLGRKTGCGTPWTIIKSTLAEYDVTYSVLNGLVEAKTVKGLQQELVRGTYLVGVFGHILCLKNGRVDDWTEGRQHRIDSVWRIESIGGKPVQNPELTREEIAERIVASTKPGTVQRKIFKLASALYADGEDEFLRERVLEQCSSTGIHPTTARIQFGHWFKIMERYENA